MTIYQQIKQTKLSNVVLKESSKKSKQCWYLKNKKNIIKIHDDDDVVVDRVTKLTAKLF